MEQKETKTCPYCGNEIFAVAKKCKHCGKWIDKDPESPHDISTEIEKDSDISNNKKTFSGSSVAASVGMLFTAILLICIIVYGFSQSNVGSKNNKIHLSDLQVKKVVMHDPLGDEEYDKYTDKNGNIYSGEAWENNDLESIYIEEGSPTEVHFHYPNGQLAVAVQAFSNGDEYYHGSFYDSNGNITTKMAFKNDYYNKYANKLTWQGLLQLTLK